MSKAHLYINSKGYYVTRHSYSGSDSFNFCARKYYLQRVQGWTERSQRAASNFGTALEKAITFWHQRGQDTAAAVAEFHRLWAEHEKAEFTYSKPERDWATLGQTGEELVKLYALRYPTYPYVIKNPLNFQVETNFEIFPGTKLAGIEFTSFIDAVAELKASGAPLIIDMKTSTKAVPDLTVLDPQLRSYAWVKNWPDVAFLWFRKMGRTISTGDPVTVLETYAGLPAGTDAFVLGYDDFGVFLVTDQKLIEDMGTLFTDKKKATEEAKKKYIEANGKHVPERVITKQRIYFSQAYITQESAEDIGRSIKRDVINIASANEKDFWPMQSGVRFPNEKCPMCEMRGICSNNPELRDTLLVRKQMDELDFGKESE